MYKNLILGRLVHKNSLEELVAQKTENFQQFTNFFQQFNIKCHVRRKVLRLHGAQKRCFVYLGGKVRSVSAHNRYRERREALLGNENKGVGGRLLMSHGFSSGLKVDSRKAQLFSKHKNPGAQASKYFQEQEEKEVRVTASRTKGCRFEAHNEPYARCML